MDAWLAGWPAGKGGDEVRRSGPGLETNSRGAMCAHPSGSFYGTWCLNPGRLAAMLTVIWDGCGSSSSTAQGASASGTARATWEPRRRRGGEGGLLTGRAISISVSLGVVPLVLPRRGSPITHRGRGWLRSTRSFRTASAPTKLATRRIRTRAWMKQRYWVAPACTSELHHGRGPGTARPFDDAGGDGTQAPPCRRTRPRG